MQNWEKLVQRRRRHRDAFALPPVRASESEKRRTSRRRETESGPLLSLFPVATRLTTRTGFALKPVLSRLPRGLVLVRYITCLCLSVFFLAKHHDRYGNGKALVYRAHAHGPAPSQRDGQRRRLRCWRSWLHQVLCTFRRLSQGTAKSHLHSSWRRSHAYCPRRSSRHCQG